MNKEETNIWQLLTGNENPGQVSIAELERLVAQYPYFAAAHLLLSQKLKQLKDERFPQQVQQTALYFPNELWLRFLLTQQPEIKKNNSREESKNPWLDSIKGANSHNESTPEEPVVITSPISASRHDTDTITAPEQETTEPQHTKIDIPEPVAEPGFLSSPVQDEPEEAPLDEEELLQQSKPLPIEESNQKIAAILTEQVEEFKKPVGNGVPVRIEADPYHTIDYFASQGIQLDNRANGDGFNQKVHKFTDWLRKMKKIYPERPDLGTNEAEETLVEHIAASSNLMKEVLTESMAEVLIKQEKNEQAVEIYQKLSLLYPAKSAYFAAKIEQLKKSE